jgi:hypothetical protein
MNRRIDSFDINDYFDREFEACLLAQGSLETGSRGDRSIVAIVGLIPTACENLTVIAGSA